MHKSRDPNEILILLWKASNIMLICSDFFDLKLLKGLVKKKVDHSIQLQTDSVIWDQFFFKGNLELLRILTNISMLPLVFFIHDSCLSRHQKSAFRSFVVFKPISQYYLKLWGLVVTIRFRDSNSKIYILFYYVSVYECATKARVNGVWSQECR